MNSSQSAEIPCRNLDASVGIVHSALNAVDASSVQLIAFVKVIPCLFI